jgi:hypothetical protein
VLFSWSHLLKVNSKQVFLKKVKLDNMPFLHSHSVWNKWLSVLTKWIKKLSILPKADTSKSRNKSPISWRKLVTNLKLSNSSLFPDGMVTIC